MMGVPERVEQIVPPAVIIEQGIYKEERLQKGKHFCRFDMMQKCFPFTVFLIVSSDGAGYLRLYAMFYGVFLSWSDRCWPEACLCILSFSLVPRFLL